MNRQVKGDQETCKVAVVRSAQTLVSTGTSFSSSRLLPVLKEPCSEYIREGAKRSDSKTETWLCTSVHHYHHNAQEEDLQVIHKHKTGITVVRQ